MWFSKKHNKYLQSERRPTPQPHQWKDISHLYHIEFTRVQKGFALVSHHTRFKWYAHWLYTALTTVPHWIQLDSH